MCFRPSRIENVADWTDRYTHAVMGLGAAIHVMGVWFDLLRYVGAAYLVWLGIKLLRSKGDLAIAADRARPGGSFFLQGFIVIMSNPKMLVLFGALIPPFISPTGDYSSQLLTLGLTFAAIALVGDTCYALASGKAAYKMAKLGPADVDAFELYDAFTINTILFLEDLGACKKGEGGAFVEGGRIGPKGSLPVNTNGGGLSYCHPGMYGLFLLIEAVRQLRGECGARQVADCEVALAHGNGGVLSTQATVILGTSATV
jgi:hypothetical protein